MMQDSACKTRQVATQVGKDAKDGGSPIQVSMAGYMKQSLETDAQNFASSSRVVCVQHT
jgi:hypothetical protein